MTTTCWCGHRMVDHHTVAIDPWPSPTGVVRQTLRECRVVRDVWYEGQGRDRVHCNCEQYAPDGSAT